MFTEPLISWLGHNQGWVFENPMSFVHAWYHVDVKLADVTCTLLFGAVWVQIPDRFSRTAAGFRSFMRVEMYAISPARVLLGLGPCTSQKWSSSGCRMPQPSSVDSAPARRLWRSSRATRDL